MDAKMLSERRWLGRVLMNSTSCLTSEPVDSNNVEPSPLYAGIVRRVRQGDPEGMAELYECILAGLHPYLARQLRQQDCRDKVHSIFVDVVVAIQRGQLRDPERLLGFAKTIARRKVAGYIGRAMVDRRQLDIASVFSLASPHASAEKEMISREQRDLVRWTLAQLSGREREILSRFYVQEQTQQQICLEMGLSHTQYRLLKWRSKAHFGQLSRRQIASLHLRSLCANKPQ
jgi:RNA polymerase sigma-70 factor, ECF subfamily